jgi:cytochrome c oxidase subunit 4/cytochrome o ubiquinol oxidase operon protein cyoD
MANARISPSSQHMPTPIHEEEAFEQQEGEHHSSLIYWLVGAVLGVITILEVFVAGLWFSHVVMILFLVAMAIVKGALIIAVFMHMQGDAGIFKFVFLAPFSIAVFFMIAFLLLFSGHVGIAG